MVSLSASLYLGRQFPQEGEGGDGAGLDKSYGLGRPRDLCCLRYRGWLSRAQWRTSTMGELPRYPRIVNRDQCFVGPAKHLGQQRVHSSGTEQDSVSAKEKTVPAVGADADRNHGPIPRNAKPDDLITGEFLGLTEKRLARQGEFMRSGNDGQEEEDGASHLENVPERMTVDGGLEAGSLERWLGGDRISDSHEQGHRTCRFRNSMMKDFFHLVCIWSPLRKLNPDSGRNLKSGVHSIRG